eukprot:SAG31_NODE_56_length_29726_cov_41.443312_27_plen_53_part_00
MHATSPIFTDAVDDLAAAMAAHDKVIPGKKLLSPFCDNYQRNTGLLSRDVTH